MPERELDFARETLLAVLIVKCEIIAFAGPWGNNFRAGFFKRQLGIAIDGDVYPSDH
jgi:hypothetical protein